MTKEQEELQELRRYLWEDIPEGYDLAIKEECDSFAEKLYNDGWRRQVEAEWGGINGDTCSSCGISLGDIMDADSDYRPSFRIESLVACPFCGARMRKDWEEIK